MGLFKATPIKIAERFSGYKTKALMAGAVGIAMTAGAAKSHPVRNLSQGLTGDPRFMYHMLPGTQPGYGANIHSDGNTEGITTEGGGYSVNPNPDQQLRMNEQISNGNRNPDGSIVFGLYSRRSS